MPRLVINLFAKSNGVIIKVGDASHANAVEVITCYPDWAERNEKILQQFLDALKPQNTIGAHSDIFYVT